MAACERDTAEPAVKNPRFTLLTEEEIDELVVAKDSQNTKEVINYAVNVLKSYCDMVHTTIGDVETLNEVCYKTHMDWHISVYSARLWHPEGL